MSNDRRKVLEMLAEGKISPDDAERLLAKLSESESDAGGEAEAGAGGAKRPLKYLRVVVNSEDGDRVNIRVPIPLVRTGLMLTTVIPAGASEELKRQGEDLSGLSGLKGEELIEALRDLDVDVDSGDGDTVRVFCE